MYILKKIQQQNLVVRAIAVLNSSLITNDKVWFINNVAEVHGGAIFFPEPLSDNGPIYLSGNFFNNTAR